MIFRKKWLSAVAAWSALVAAPVAAEEWDNPSERYLDAYKAYTDASCPIGADDMRHFVYFARDREALRGHALLTSKRFDGAQVMYTWRELEPRQGSYDFSSVREDVDYLAAHGKKLFLQLQDASFSPKNQPVPEYLLSPAYDGGATHQYDDDGEIEGWVAKRWRAEVRARFAALLEALGNEFDGEIEGINLQESAIGVSQESDPGFTPELYAEGLMADMRTLKSAFPHSTTMQYANFMPGEWLPWEDEGYLRGLYELGEELGVGLGAPDLMPQRKGQLNHALAMMHENAFTAPLGIAIQDGNYIGETNTDERLAYHKNLVPMLHAFAADFLHVKYMFWVDQEPYFDEDVLPCLDTGFQGNP
ncbi:hypothetical protein FMN50_06055 [Rhodobacterales bacterium]|nr:hypothetical protein FMN50_06055 [Rhodobacterales bacterium]